ncbi:reticulophagy regulator 1 [Corythoichthys intestinalis]|uniref:reticulophagy regulator 1 n=1 Tax=Corythoichthys intestinalis TaxID=161448 RepID=UPI0025A5CA02|nr:reticulophagy regulator 1 [Corythoichthys intestinalis]
MLANREEERSAGGAQPALPGRRTGEEALPGRHAGGLLSSLVDWERRACRTFVLFAASNAAIWLSARGCLRAYCLLAFGLLLMVVVATVRDVIPSASKGDDRVSCGLLPSRETMDRKSGSELQTSGSMRLFLQETSAFKRQNPGKFCLLACSFCTFFAVLGRYIPGIVISYFLVSSAFLWPVLSSPEASFWLKPLLQKVDFGVAALLQKIKEDHERRILKAGLEKESAESDLSSMFPKLDSAACKELSVSDTSVSDVTWTDNLNLSEETTPQTENSEDLDREEVFSGGLYDFPSVDNGAATNGDDDDAADALELVQCAVRDAVAAAVLERAEAATGFRFPKPSEESDGEADDFELLDQAELDQLGAELDLPGGGGIKAGTEERGDKPPGFFAKLLRRH